MFLQLYTTIIGVMDLVILQTLKAPNTPETKNHLLQLQKELLSPYRLY